MRLDRSPDRLAGMRCRRELMKILVLGCAAWPAAATDGDARFHRAIRLADFARYEEARDLLGDVGDATGEDATRLKRWLEAMAGIAPRPAGFGPLPCCRPRVTHAPLPFSEEEPDPLPGFSSSRYRFRMDAELPLLEEIRAFHHIDPGVGLLDQGALDMIRAAGGTSAPLFARFFHKDLSLETFTRDPGGFRRGFVRLESAEVTESGTGPARAATWTLHFESGGPGWFPLQVPITGESPAGFPPAPMVPLLGPGMAALAVDHPVMDLTIPWPAPAVPAPMDALPVPLPLDLEDDFSLTLDSGRQEPTHRARGRFHVEPWKEPWFGSFGAAAISRFTRGGVEVEILGTATATSRVVTSVTSLIEALARRCARALPRRLDLLLLSGTAPDLHGFHRDGIIGLRSPELEPGAGAQTETELDPRGSLAHELIHWALAREPAGWPGSDPGEGVAESCARQLLSDTGLAGVAQIRGEQLTTMAGRLDPLQHVPVERLAARRALPGPFAPDTLPDRRVLDYVVLPDELAPYSKDLLSITQSVTTRWLTLEALRVRLTH